MVHDRLPCGGVLKETDSAVLVREHDSFTVTLPPIFCGELTELTWSLTMTLPTATPISKRGEKVQHMQSQHSREEHDI